MSLSATTRSNCCICSCESAPVTSGVKWSEGVAGCGADEALSLRLPAPAALRGAEVRAPGAGGAGLVGSCWPRTHTPASSRSKMGHSFPIRYLTSLEGTEFPEDVRDGRVMPNRLAATFLGVELRPSDVLSVAEGQLRCHLPLIGKLFRNIVDSVDLENWKKRLLILNWTVVTGNGRHPPAPSGLERCQQSSPFRHSTALRR